MVSLADGGDQGGSLRNPASFCNVVGLRPPIGRVSRAPVTTGWPTLSVLGPLGRTVADVALLYSALAGFDPADPNSIPGDGSAFLEIAEEEPRQSLSGLRVGWTPDLGGLPVDAAVTAVLETAGRGAFQRLGAQLADWTPDFTGADEAFLTQRGWSVVNALGDAYRANPELFGENVRMNVAEGATVTPERLHRAAALQVAVRARVLAAFEHADILAMPTVQLPPFPGEWEWPREVAGVPHDHYLMWMRSCWYITITGLPAISVPCGFTADGLPVGIQLVGRPYGEAELLRVARAFENANPAGLVRPDFGGTDLAPR
jgi:amidase